MGGGPAPPQMLRPSPEGLAQHDIFEAMMGYHIRRIRHGLLDLEFVGLVEAVIMAVKRLDPLLPMGFGCPKFWKVLV